MIVKAKWVIRILFISLLMMLNFIVIKANSAPSDTTAGSPVIVNMSSNNPVIQGKTAKFLNTAPVGTVFQFHCVDQHINKQRCPAGKFSIAYRQQDKFGDNVVHIEPIEPIKTQTTQKQ